MGFLVRAGVRMVVFSSTCATYGDPKEIPISEKCPQWPKNPYGWSKFCMERLLESYDLAHGFKFTSLRYFNAAGATEKCGEDHDPETHLIPNVLAVAAGEKPELAVFGNNYPTPDGTPVRDYIHVSDLADAHILALGHLRHGGKSEALNVGTGHGYSVLEVIECARQVTNREITHSYRSATRGRCHHLDCRLIEDSERSGMETCGIRSADHRSVSMELAAATSKRLFQINLRPCFAKKQTKSRSFHLAVSASNWYQDAYGI